MLAAGDVVGSGWTGRAALGAAPTLGDHRDLPIVHEDDTLVVLEQAGRTPRGAAASAGAKRRSVFDDLKEYLRRRGSRRPFVVHRIDRDTSGLVVFAKTAARRRLQGSVPPPRAGAGLLAVVYGQPSPRPARGATIWCGTSGR